MVSLLNIYKDNEEFKFWEGNGYKIQAKKRAVQHDMFSSSSDLTDSYSEEELLANTLYIFLLLVVFSIILGCTLFGIREYALSKPPSTHDAGIEDTFYPLPPVFIPAQASCTKKDSPDSNVDDTMNSGSISPSLPILHEKNRVANYRSNAQPITPLARIDIIQSEETTNEFIRGSLSKYLNEKFSSTEPSPVPEEDKKQNNNSKIVYSIRQMHEIRQSQSRSSSSAENGEADYRIYSTLRYSSFIPPSVFQSAYTADRQINEASFLLLHTTASDMISGISIRDEVFIKTMSVLNVVSIGFTSIGNPNYFLNSFSELVVTLIDTGNIFNLVEEIVSVPLQQEFISMVLIYFWSNWVYRSGVSKLSQRLRTQVEVQLHQWKMTEPDLIAPPSILRALLNLELGFHGLRKIDDKYKRTLTEKNRELLKFICKDARCNDYLGFLPLISQAIGVTKISENLLIFYDLALEIITQHGKCCMSMYITDTTSGLKELVQHGLWIQHHYTVCERANSIYYTLKEQGYKEVESWMEEVHRGRTYVSSSVVEFEKLGIKDTREEKKRERKVATPGSWTFEEAHGEKTQELNGYEKEERGHEIQRSPSLRRYGYQLQ
ncbi:hypothetical protein CLIB1423_01S08988 [[Candida] railenensis]|uniref:Uncharacterized protein n=1 Tax=[Candida] railenensis TaxID=45579 RepID=A0A9P0QKN5_9ASCO|nr:hypothetical protein CLIB1423_01S08988 [[Candida] railenensis]